MSWGGDERVWPLVICGMKRGASKRNGKIHVSSVEDWGCGMWLQKYASRPDEVAAQALEWLTRANSC